MSFNKLWLAPLALLVGAASASPDILYMQDGRRIRGELVTVNAGTVIFNQDNGNYTRARRIRVNRADVMRIDLTDNSYFDDTNNDSDVYTPGYGNGSLGSGAGTGTQRDYGNQWDIAVRGNQQWTDTGIRLNAGDTFRVDSSGSISWGPGRSDGPDGEVNSPYNANRPVPNRAGGSLIGRIGNGEPFFIGAGNQSFRAATSGRLYLGINDDYLQDNSGSFRVMVTR